MALPQYLLDGQQRLTSLHRVYKEHPEADIVFNVEDERFQVQSAATAKDPRWVKVADVLTVEKLSQMRKAVAGAHPHLDEDDIDERLQRVRAIDTYEYYLEILTDLAYEEVAQIFVRVNSGGRALKTVDLTLALLSVGWPGVVAKIEAEADACAKKGWPKVDAAFLVRALAATATDTAVLAALRTADTQALEAGWERVHYGLQFLITLLGENAKIKTSNLIPSMNALIPLVTLLGRQKGKEFTDSDALVYWMLGVFITNRYSAAADTKIAQDSLAARSPDPIEALYKSASLLDAQLSVGPQQLIGKGAGSPYFLLSYLVAKREGAKDWWHDVEISESGSEGGFAIEYHHVHPQKTLRGVYSKSEINDLSNLAFISATANKKISGRSPADYFPELIDEAAGRDELSPHLVPLDESLRKQTAYRPFLMARRELLTNKMTELLDSYRPPELTATPSTDEQIERSVSITLYAGPSGRVVFEAQRGEVQSVATCGHADLERFLNDAVDGVASSLSIGVDVAMYDPDSPDIAVPLGPYDVTGTLTNWRDALTREIADAVAIQDMPEVQESPAHEAPRELFSVIDTD